MQRGTAATLEAQHSKDNNSMKLKSRIETQRSKDNAHMKLD